jgi:hypothetical protein
MIIKNIMRLRPVRPRSSSTAGLSDTARRRIDGRQTYDSRIVVFFLEKGGGNVGDVVIEFSRMNRILDIEKAR